MAGLHAVALIALTLAIPGAAEPSRKHMPHDRSDKATVTLAGGDEPGGLTIVNHGTSVQWIARALTVERRDGARWRPVSTTLDLVAACDPRFPRRAAPVRLLPGQSVSVMPWTGFGCGGQCAATCRTNVYHGAGPFRIVATLLPGNARVTGPAFTMPDRPQPRAASVLTFAEIEAAAKQPRPGDNEP